MDQIIANMEKDIQGPKGGERMSTLEILQEMLQVALGDLEEARVGHEKLKALLSYFTRMEPEFTDEESEKFINLMKANIGLLPFTCVEHATRIRGRTYIEAYVKEEPTLRFLQKSEEKISERRLIFMIRIGKALVGMQEGI